MRVKGKVASWNDAKGFGFVAPSDGSKKIFFHISEIKQKSRRPELNQAVTYTLAKNADGRPCATKVRLPSSLFSITRKSMAMLTAALFFIVLGASALNGQLPTWMLFYFGLASTVTYIVYGVDKTAAQKGVHRISEVKLHLLSIAGGWPGALVAQQVRRHKTQKTSFRIVFLLSVFLNNLILFFFIFSELLVVNSL